MRSVILKTDDGVQHALARLQTIPLLQGLRELGQDATMITLPPLNRPARLLGRAARMCPA